MKPLFRCFLFVLLILWMPARAQQALWSNLTADQGLPDPNVTAFTSCSPHELFVGTAVGLYCYNGFTFTRIAFPAESNINPYISCLSTDGKYLYAGARNALIRYDPGNGNVQWIKTSRNSLGGIQQLVFNHDSSLLYAITHNSLLTVKTGQPDFSTSESPADINILGLHCDAEGKIIGFNAKGEWLRLDIPSHKVISVDKQQRDAIWWEKEQCWIVCKADGLYRFNPENASAVKLNIALNFNETENRFLYSDARSNLWIKYGQQFGCLRSLRDTALIFFNKEAGNPYTITSNSAQAFYLDQQGSTWVGGDGTGMGALTVSGSKIGFLSNESAGVEHFWCFKYIAERNELLCGTSQGLLIATCVGTSLVNPKIYRPKGFQRFAVNAVVDLDKDHWMLSVTRSGYWLMDKRSKLITPCVSINQQIITPFVFGVRQLDSSRLMLLTQTRNYLMLNKDEPLIPVYDKNKPELNSYCALLDHKGNLLTGGGFGLQVYDSGLALKAYFVNQDDSTNTLCSNVIFDIVQIKHDAYLLATMGGGLCAFDLDKSSFSSVKLQTDPVNVYGIMGIDSARVLLTTSNGLCLYNFQLGESVMLNKSNLLPFNDFNQSAFYHDSIITVVGGEKGILIILTKDLVPLFSKEVEILARNHEATIDHMVLEPGEHAVSLNLSLSSIQPNPQTTFGYMIKGIDSEMHLIPPGHQDIHYNYLPPGAYSLLIGLTDETGLIRSRSREIPILVKPYFYQTIWFALIIGLISLAITIVLVRYFAFLRLRWKLNKMDAERKIMFERSRISRELHDNLGSQLTYLISGIETTGLLHKRNQVDKTAHNLEKLQLAARESMQQLRDSIWALRPGEMTMNALLTQYEQWLTKVSEPHENLRTPISKNNFSDFNIDPITGLNVFRILQEAINNAIKHAEATTISTSINNSKTSLQITITDNGKGIIPGTAEGNGMSSMKQRAEAIRALLTIELNSKGGTSVSLTLSKNTLNG